MKKLYNKKSTVHPSPPPISDHLSLLPAAIFTLTVALSPQDKEVLAYLLSSSTKKTTTTTSKSTTAAGDHPPLFNCSCFRCYMSYWVRWDSSPNRQLIHEIIDALEDGIMVRNKKEKNKKDRKRKVNCSSSSSSNEETGSTESDELTWSPEVSQAKLESAAECRDSGGDGEEEEEEGPVRKLVSFLGERIWSVWT